MLRTAQKPVSLQGDRQ